MAKAHQYGTSMWLPAGAEPPADLPDHVRLTGPGGAAAEHRRKLAREQAGAEQGQAHEPRAEEPGAHADAPGSDGLSMEADDVAPRERQHRDVPDRPAGNASRDAWAAYVAALEDGDSEGEPYIGLTRTELQERANAASGEPDPTQVGGSK